jgi:hypothetical protein
VEVPEERDTMKRLRGLWATLQARDTATPTTTTAAVADIDRQRHGTVCSSLGTHTLVWLG